ncbi:MAG: 50S ribosomal protein L15 [Anaerofustis sp.]
MKLHTLKPAPGSSKDTIRKGRGTATGRGKTAGRGQDGQKSRSGGGVRIGFEGGQMPLTRRLPKRGFSNYRFKTEYAAINVDKLNAFEKGSVVTLEALKEKGIVKNKYNIVKILGEGDLNVAVTVKVDKLSKSAYDKIIAAGGKIEEV